jgi:hypothetical protein
VKTSRALKKRHGNWHLGIWCHSQPKKWTLSNGGSRKKLAATHGQLTQRAIPAWRKDHAEKRWHNSWSISWKSACKVKIWRLLWNGSQPGTQLVQGWQLSQAQQGRLRRNGAIVGLTADKSSVVGYSLDGNNMSTEARETSLLRSITRKRLVKAN